MDDELYAEASEAPPPNGQTTPRPEPPPPKGQITSDLKPPEGLITVCDEDLRVISTSLDPRIVSTTLNKFRYVARTETLHHRFTEKSGLLHLMVCLKRYLWNPNICKEACFLIAGFSAQHSSHSTLIQQGVVDVIIALACTHAKMALQSPVEVDILMSVVEALANFCANESTEIRRSCVDAGTERISQLVNDIIIKENESLTEGQKRSLQYQGDRIRKSLEKLCGVDKWTDKSKRNQKYYLNQHVYMLTKRGDANWKLPK